MEKEKKIPGRIKAIFVVTVLWGIFAVWHYCYPLYTQVNGFYALLVTYPFILFSGLLFGVIAVYGVKSKVARLLFGILPLALHLPYCVVLHTPLRSQDYNQLIADIQQSCGNLVFMTAIYASPFLGVLASKGIYLATKKWEDRVVYPTEIRSLRGFLAFFGGLASAVASFVLLWFLHHLFF